jgi:hypothetical protein
MGNYGSGSNLTRPGTIPTEEDPYTFDTPPSSSNVIVPPGVDPYYGVTISGLNDITGGGGSNPPPTDQSGTGGSKSNTPIANGNLVQSPLSEAEKQQYMLYLMQGGSESETGWWAMKNAMNSSNTSGSGSGMNSGSNSFKIARPNMTWENSLPSVIPDNGQQALNSYAPIPFTREANTPGASYIKPPLTYNNPYNTNPYLPTANPFALIANQSQAS